MLTQFLSLALGLVLAHSAIAAPMQIADIQKFPGYIEITYDREITSNVSDILFVVDDSGSMHTHQKSLASFADAIVQKFINNPGYDIQIGVITTSTGDDYFRKTIGGKLVSTGGTHIVNRKTPDAAKVLARNLSVGTDGQATEMPFHALQLATSEPLLSGDNAGFFRPDTHLKIALFTDAEDQSEMTAESLLADLRQFQSSKAPRSELQISGFVATDANTCQKDDSKEPLKVLELLQLTKGQQFPICSTDLAPGLQNLFGEQGLAIEIPLTIEPNLSSIEVFYGTQVIPPGLIHQGWVYDEELQMIRIGTRVSWSAQPEGTKLKVRFKPSAWE